MKNHIIIFILCMTMSSQALVAKRAAPASSRLGFAVAGAAVVGGAYCVAKKLGFTSQTPIRGQAHRTSPKPAPINHAWTQIQAMQRQALANATYMRKKAARDQKLQQDNAQRNLNKSQDADGQNLEPKGERDATPMVKANNNSMAWWVAGGVIAAGGLYYVGKSIGVKQQSNAGTKSQVV
jgi:hypothetical protein